MRGLENWRGGARRRSDRPESPKVEILEEFPDLKPRMAEALRGAADWELRRQINESDD